MYYRWFGSWPIWLFNAPLQIKVPGKLIADYTDRRILENICLIADWAGCNINRSDLVLPQHSSWLIDSPSHIIFQKGKKKQEQLGNITLAIQRRSETIVPTSYSIAPASRKSLIPCCPQGRLSAPPLDPASFGARYPSSNYSRYICGPYYIYT